MYEAVFRHVAKNTLHKGVREGFHYLISLSIFVDFVLLSAYFRLSLTARAVTRPFSTNPVSTCELGITRGTCFVARRLKVIAVAVLLCF